MKNRYDVIVEISKFNPYHDERGRFTSANRGGSAGASEVFVGRVWAKSAGGGGSYTAGGSSYKPGGTYGDAEYSVPPSDEGSLTVNIAPRASGFYDGKYVSGNNDISILNNGNVVVPDGYDVSDRVRMAVRNEVERLGGATEQGVFYRGTNNRNEISILESGKLRNSRNHSSGEEEDGVSVWDGIRIQSHKYTYKVTGDIIGQGSDGEPLLDPKSIKVVGRMKSTGSYADEFHAASRAGEIEFCRKYGWTRAQLEQALRGGYKRAPLTSRATRNDAKKSLFSPEYANEASRTVNKSESVDIDEIVEISKFNPYHDSRGRFSSSPGGGGGSSLNPDAFFADRQNARLYEYTDKGKEYIPKEIELYSRYQQGTANQSNFMHDTVAVFQQTSRPRRPPDYVSRDRRTGKVSSEYWYTDDGVIRGSDHWGTGVASCDWGLQMRDGSGYYGRDGRVTHTPKLYGKVSWGDFTYKTDIAEIEGKRVVTTFNTSAGKGLVRVDGKTYSYNSYDRKWSEIEKSLDEIIEFYSLEE